MRKSITARIDKNLKELIDNISREEGISKTQASREIWKEITGHSLLEPNKKEEAPRERMKSLFG